MYPAFFTVTELIHRTSVDGFGQVPSSQLPFLIRNFKNQILK